MVAIHKAFTDKTGIAVKQNIVDHSTFQNSITNYLGGTPDDRSPGSPGTACGSSPPRACPRPIDDVWAKVGAATTPTA